MAKAMPNAKRFQGTINVNDVVMVTNIRIALERSIARGELSEAEKENIKRLSLEGKTGTVEDIMKENGRVTYRIRMRDGALIALGRGNVRPLCPREGGDDVRNDLKKGTTITLLDSAGTYTVGDKAQGQIHVQDDLSSLQKWVSPNNVGNVLPLHQKDNNMRLKPFLRSYQHKCVDYFLQQRRSVAILRPGSGKTLCTYATFLRMQNDRSCAVRLAPSNLTVIITEAGLVESVWAKQAWEHGIHDLVYFVFELQSIPCEMTQCIVISFHRLCMVVKSRKIFDERNGTLWGRRVRAVFVDEVHRLIGEDGRLWNSSVHILCKTADIVVGLTATIFPSDIRKVSNICRALGLHEDLRHESFWEQPQCLIKACSVPEYGFLRLSDEETLSEAPMRPENPPWKYATYISSRWSRDVVFPSGKDVLMRHIMEALGCSSQEAIQFDDDSTTERDRQKYLAAFDPQKSSKTTCLLAVLKDLYLGKSYRKRHFKIFLTVYYKHTVSILYEVLTKAKFSPEDSVFMYTGKMNACKRSASLDEFLEVPCDASHFTIMIMSIAAGACGLNVTNTKNPERSPSAHVEYEQTFRGASRFQVQQRVDRDGNGEVQFVILTGNGTENQNTMDHQLKQVENQCNAGCNALKRRFETVNE